MPRTHDEPVKFIPGIPLIRVELYVGRVDETVVVSLFGDLSTILVTVDPLVTVLGSDTSNHNTHPGIFRGDKVLPGKSFRIPHLAAR